ncbi:MAG: hypothetical protein RIR18_824 [Pseudomonadota bacterium]
MKIIPIKAVAPAPVGDSDPLNFQVPPPLSLYIHIPWCVQKCPYCDFNSHASKGLIPEKTYLDALIADLESALPLIWGRPIVSIFFGGGTPSLISPEGIDGLLSQIRMRLKVLPGAEITLEANPGTMEANRFVGFREAGITRLSLGIQSFNENHLKALGRIHGRNEALAAAVLAGEHFEQFNLDLMYGLPGQTMVEALADIETALSFQPAHLSCYQLTLEPNTHFAAFPPDLPDGDVCADMQEALEARLASAGFQHYETSAFAQAGRRCQHNLNYWQFGDYIGIGAGAHSKLTQHDRVIRQMRWKHPEAYLQQIQTGNAVQENREITGNELSGEFLMNALRLVDGFDSALFQATTAQQLVRIEPILYQAVKDGLLEVSANVVKPTLRGQRFLNVLLQRFL